MYKLFIDTRNNQHNIVKLEAEEKEYMAESSPDKIRGDVLLKLIEKVCKDAKISLQDIDKIYCEKGPGSFTGLRVGFAIANVLSLALLVPINDNEIGVIDTPVYE